MFYRTLFSQVYPSHFATCHVHDRNAAAHHRWADVRIASPLSALSERSSHCPERILLWNLRLEAEPPGTFRPGTVTSDSFVNIRRGMSSA
ncbi:unnamed protein product, partial [Nesidiocoris tenuis]